MQCTLFARIPLQRRDGTIVAYTIVDVEQAAYLSQWRWRLHSGGYAYRAVGSSSTGNRRLILMHRVILGLSEGGHTPEADHVNRDRLDNRLSNLRLATHAENMQNRPSHHGGSSKYRGVHWDASAQRWRTMVKINGKRYFRRVFRDEDEAGAAVKAWRLAHMPFAVD